jgi:hypothetical protein
VPITPALSPEDGGEGKSRNGTCLTIGYNIYIVKHKSSFLSEALTLPEGPTRTAAVAAWIQSLYPSAPPILVGGAAVELYTGGAYTTGDLDFVGSVPATVSKALEEAGFRREGRHWIHEKEELFVEFPGSQIGADERTAVLDVGGTAVLTLSPEDMIVDRLAAWQFWRSTTDGASAFLIWKAQKDRLDLKRLQSLAQRRKVEKGYEKLRGFAGDTSDRSVSPEELERWARDLP